MSPSTEQRENREAAAEIKFLLTPDLAAAVHDWARARLAPDPHAPGAGGDGYRITSIYFDTEDFDVFRRRGSFGRSKFRVRRYGDSQTVFLERKLKTRGQVTKRRTMVPVQELRQLYGEDPVGWAGRWYWRRLRVRRLRPICQITYSRTARVAMTNRGPIRLTLDEGLRAKQTEAIAFREVAEGTRLLENSVVMELKYRAHVPVVFKLLVEEFALMRQPISKYRLAVAALGLPTETELVPLPVDLNRSMPCLTS